MWMRPYRTSDNRIEGVVMALVDVTERKRAAEARYRRLFEASKDGIIIADAESGEILDVNPYITKFFAHPRTLLLGARFWETELFAGADVTDSFLNELRRLDSIHKTTLLTAESGERKQVDIIASLYSEGERKVVQFNIRDVAARRRQEEQRERSEDQ